MLLHTPTIATEHRILVPKDTEDQMHARRPKPNKTQSEQGFWIAVP
jgi:hypothetical protein